MKFDDYTLAVLKNFAEINPGFKFVKGKLQRTVNSTDTILAEIEFTEDFPIDFSIYDLRRLVSNIMVDREGEGCDFDEDKVTIDQFNIPFKLFGCDGNLIKYTDDNLAVSDSSARIQLPNDLFQNMMKTADINGLNCLTFIGIGNELFIKVHSDGSSSDYADVPVGENISGIDFRAEFLTANLRILPMDYIVDIEFNNGTPVFGRFMSEDESVKYYIATQA